MTHRISQCRFPLPATGLPAFVRCTCGTSFVRKPSKGHRDQHYGLYQAYSKHTGIPFHY